MADAGKGRGVRVRLAWAVGHPVRRRILGALADGEDPPGPSQIAHRLGVAVATVAYHLAVLRELGVVEPADELGE